MVTFRLCCQVESTPQWHIMCIWETYTTLLHSVLHPCSAVYRTAGCLAAVYVWKCMSFHTFHLCACWSLFNLCFCAMQSTIKEPSILICLNKIHRFDCDPEWEMHPHILCVDRMLNFHNKNIIKSFLVATFDLSPHCIKRLWQRTVWLFLSQVLHSCVWHTFDIPSTLLHSAPVSIFSLWTHLQCPQ